MLSRAHRIAFIASTLILTMSACREATMPELTTEPAFGRNSGKAGSAPTAPKNLTATAVGPYSVSLAWEPSSSSVFEYRLRFNMGSYEYRVPGTQTSFNWTDALYPNINYEFWVYAIDAAGNKSANSNILRVTTPADNQAPTAPALSTSQVGHSYVTLNWSSTDQGGRINYQIRQDGVVILRGFALNGFTEATSGTAIFLQPSTTYTFTAVARDFVGNLSQTSQLVVTTRARDPNEVTPPTTPTNLSAYPIDGARELLVTWTQSTDNVDPQAAITYEIFLNGVRDDVQVGRGQSTVYGVPGENTLTVVAIDANGNRSAPASYTLFLQ
jgi:chitinase